MDSRKLLTVQEAADRLGMTTANVYHLCSTGALPRVKVLNSIRIEESAVEALLLSRAQR